MGESIERGSMTRDEVKELLMTIKAIYPNFNVKPEEMTPTINAWHLMLEEYPAEAIGGSLRVYVKTNNSGFAPSVAQLINSMYAVKTSDNPSEGDAWAMVKRAISDGNYHADERFAELPEIVRKAVGNANMIRQWAMCDTSEVNTVVMSNFQRNYRTMVQRAEMDQRIPKALAEKVTLGIGVNE